MNTNYLLDLNGAFNDQDKQFQHFLLNNFKISEYELVNLSISFQSSGYIDLIDFLDNAYIHNKLERQIILRDIQNVPEADVVKIEVMQLLRAIAYQMQKVLNIFSTWPMQQIGKTTTQVGVGKFYIGH